MEWLSVGISIISTIVAFAAFYWRVKVHNQELQAKQAASSAALVESIHKEVAAIQKAHNEDIAAVRLDLQRKYDELYSQVDERRRKDVQDLHKRVNDLESRSLNAIGDRLGKIEGRLDSVNNTLTLIQRHFIENQGGDS